MNVSNQQMENQNKEQKNKYEGKRFRFYNFYGYMFPGEIINVETIAAVKIKRPLTLEECPVFGECVLHGVIRFQYTPPLLSSGSLSQENITWKLERGLPIKTIQPWQDSVERAILSSSKFCSLMGTPQDTSKGIANIELPYYSWLITPLYIEEPYNIFSIPFTSIPLLMDFIEITKLGLIDKPEPGQWEEALQKMQKAYQEKGVNPFFAATSTV
ncbi:MAG: hypothetical protein QXU32_11560 [Nitrososphaerales archaeon]